MHIDYLVCCFISLDSSTMLPCEFCQQPFPPEILIEHMVSSVFSLYDLKLAVTLTHALFLDAGLNLAH